MISTVWLILLTTVTIINIIAHFAIKFNDMKHIADDIQRIWTSIEKIEDETKKQGERISKIEGRLNGN